MKKILSVLLVICAVVLFTEGVNAAVIEAGTCTGGKDLQTAINDSNNGDTIQLCSDIVTGVARLEIRSKTLTLDLNGHNITKPTGGTEEVLYIRESTVLITGEGTIEELDNKLGGIFIKGSDTNPTLNPTNVTIDEKVTVKGFYGVGVDALTSKVSYGITLTVKGTLIGRPNSVPDAGGGLYVNGNIKHIDGCPVITIEPTAVITGTGDTGLGIYAAGYANWTINGGTVTGVGSALGIKAGKFVINGGTFTATGAALTPAGHGNGINPSGAVIQIESSSGYAGDIDIKINDGTFTSTNGYVFYEYLGAGTETTVNGLEINDGIFTAADNKDVFLLSNEFKEEVTEFVNGGTFSSDPTAYAASGVDFTANADGTYGPKVETPPAPIPTPNPQTFDDIVIYITLILLSLTGLGLVLYKKKQMN